ncbi:MAG: hypothetical protein A2660_01455 [Candidatus Doudnabacteria bacterium RIFCSPHIGHO2_01_FULL_45_18]|uniref:Uncharacterized protein n=1 Tax=Candidatus Doudnabacteria bacterium RIFCSPHIGHO2_01_FULL_45_18 TaxID=1817823 RepID=A0A1F5NSM9_9BACT|nr:MAG: hypothetical protein A2660_01455 [Candidatus Doudnabacteria bacterium RIFCSPHIGHO2_01_FULL_45_18]
MQGERMETSTEHPVREFLNQQSYAYICVPLGHSAGFVLPLQIREAEKQTLVACRHCGREWWQTIPDDIWPRFMADVAAGKIK